MLNLLANNKKLPFKILNTVAITTATNKNLTNDWLNISRSLTEPRIINGNISPAENLLALSLSTLL
jgi:hypothetical protein